MMKKALTLLLAFIMICGSTVSFYSCKEDSTPITPGEYKFSECKIEWDSKVSEAQKAGVAKNTGFDKVEDYEELQRSGTAAMYEESKFTFNSDGTGSFLLFEDINVEFKWTQNENNIEIEVLDSQDSDIFDGVEFRVSKEGNFEMVLKNNLSTTGLTPILVYVISQ